MKLVMTHQGLQVETEIPDEEMPDEIVFQGVRYFRERTCTLEHVPSYVSTRYKCSACGWTNSFYDLKNYCPCCGAKVVEE